MPTKPYLGEFEQLVLLTILQLRENSYAPNISRVLEEKAGRGVSRGALYATLDRLERKRFVEWKIEAATSRRRGNLRRLFTVTPSGVDAAAESREALLKLWKGLGGMLTRSG